MKNWYVLYVNVRHENKIAAKLNAKGIETYVPNIKVRKQWSDRKKTIDVPLISGYIFSYLDSTDLDKPLFVSGVVNYVKFNGKPAVVRSLEIEGLKYFVNHGYSLEIVDSDKFKIGDKVKFSMADFKNFTATIEEFLGDDFAIITFEGVAKNLKLKAPIDALKKKNISK